MNELGTELDGTGRMGITDGEDAAAWTIARFEDLNVNACLVQRTRSRESGRTRADHHHHVVT